MVFVMNIIKISIVLSLCSPFQHLETLLTDYYKRVKVVQVKNTLGIKDNTNFCCHAYYHFLLIERVGLAKFGEKTLHHGPFVY